MQRRLILFFVSISFLLILSFTLLLTLFGINGKQEETIRKFIGNELTRISRAVSEDFSYLSVEGINLALEIAQYSDLFFEKNGITAAELTSHPNLLEALLSVQMAPLLNTVNNRSCGGVFVMLDATVNPNAPNADSAKAGIFIKKTQPTSTQSLGVTLHCLRGPAQVARNNDIGLMAQWKMEYDIEGQEFFTHIMETARNTPDTAISRLYRWTGRITLKGNSEAGFLLCVPLRSQDGTVFGLCGIEVSDRMFKSLYSPDSDFDDSTFAVAAPADGECIKTSQGIIAGNYYLTGIRLNHDLFLQSKSDTGFEYFSVNDTSYGGKSTYLKLYPTNSPYENEAWVLAVLMPETILNTAIKGDFPAFVLISIVLLFLSLAISVAISRHYLRPVIEALNSIQNSSYHEQKTAPYLEISDLFEFLSEKDREHKEVLQQIAEEKRNMESRYDMVQTYASHLANERIPEVDTDNFELFLQYLHTLTPKEKIIFDLYLEGKSAKDILEIANISQNTLKYHNKNIYSKLGVTSRKQLLEYAAMMKLTQYS